ncbi:MAG TPA: UDP-N-acetylglucosamine 2-epimerase (non-hydrolyzing) [Myxococcota bacterium]
MKRVLCLFGTRPEIIKLAPVLRALAARRERIATLHVASSQHQELLHPFARDFDVRIDRDLRVMEDGQSPTAVASRVLVALDPLIRSEAPDLLLIQGDTTTAMAGALAGFQLGVPVGHVEAGLRSGDLSSPFPEEMNRRLITRLARLHFAPTAHNVAALRAEGVPDECIALTGNPIVDALQATRSDAGAAAQRVDALVPADGTRLVVLTSHRRESFGAAMEANLRVLRRFVEKHQDVSLAVSVHPNPQVREPTRALLGDAQRIRLLDPLPYADFLELLARAWLVVTDSGGIQEEAPSLGKAVLVLRDTTERPEAIEAGVARLVGRSHEHLETALEGLAADDAWIRRVRAGENPYGAGDAGERIADAIESFLATRAPDARAAAAPPRRLADFVAAAKCCIAEIPPEEARRLLDAPDREGWQFVDVREPDEFAAGHVPGARNSPRGFLEVRADLEHKKRDPWFEDRNLKLLLYCGGGHRSALAAQALQQMGFTRVLSLAEGWTGWTERGYPQER